MKLFPRLALALVSPWYIAVALADVKLPAIISDHLVLSKAARVPIWGKAAPGEQVTVRLNGQVASATAGADGKWSVALDLKASAPGPFEMTVAGKNQVVISDVLVGEVWVASGQSNMDFTVSRTNNAEADIAQSANPLLRVFQVKKNAVAQPLEETEGKWLAASPETTGGFTAVGYFFAKKLQADLNVPVGVIHTAWGGTPSEAWTSAESIGSVPDLKASSDKQWTAVKNYPIKKKAYVEKFPLWLTENAREDKPVADASIYAGMDVSTAGWVPVKFPGLVKADGLPEAGAIWVRREVTLSKNGQSIPLTLGIDGFDSVYWNGTLLAQTTYKNFGGIWSVHRNGPYNVPAKLVNEGKNILAIRFFSPVGPTKFTRAPGVDTFTFGDGWLAKAEYEFPPIDAAKLATAPPPPYDMPAVQNVASSLFNGMISPLFHYAIRGAIWYQGESNASRAFQYRTAFPLMIADWRKHWNQGDFPFYFCQLANFQAKKNAPGDSNWAELREAQSMTLRLPNTGQAVLIDIGESDDIHLRNKKDAGERLAMIALAKDYNKSLPYSGPVYQSLKIEGNKAILSFQHVEGGLVAKPLAEKYDVRSLIKATAPLVRNSPNSALEGFSLCGEDQKWFWADAQIVGDTVVVTSPKVAVPVAVRYGWADNPTCNLYNGAGLPASPFRTDDYTPVTLNGKY